MLSGENKCEMKQRMQKMISHISMGSGDGHLNNNLNLISSNKINTKFEISKIKT